MLFGFKSSGVHHLPEMHLQEKCDIAHLKQEYPS